MILCERRRDRRDVVARAPGAHVEAATSATHGVAALAERVGLVAFGTVEEGQL